MGGLVVTYDGSGAPLSPYDDWHRNGVCVAYGHVGAEREFCAGNGTVFLEGVRCGDGQGDGTWTDRAMPAKP